MRYRRLNNRVQEESDSENTSKETLKNKELKTYIKQMLFYLFENLGAFYKINNSSFYEHSIHA